MQHIGFIMDGNRSWAKAKGLPTFEGHRQGYENAKKILELCDERKIPYVSFWALSDDNIRKRDPDELMKLFRLLEVGILDLAKRCMKHNIRLVSLGDHTLIPESCRKNIKKAEEKTAKNTGTTVISMIAYGGQEEIIRAIHAAAKAGEDMGNIREERFSQYIESSQYPPVDLIVRTGGHMRHSGFFLYHSPYAEYYFSPKHWPAFGELDLEEAIRAYGERERKFGK